MIKTGKIKNYNQERGFGFIESNLVGKDVFFHIKDFPKGILPQIGESLTFNLGQDGDKIKAVNIIRLDYPTEKSYSTTPERIVSKSRNYKQNHKESNSFLGMVLSIICIGVVGYFVYGFIQNSLHRRELTNQPVTQETLAIANTQAINTNPNNFSCDGRVHCSQMSSKAEAQWFLNNCPGTKMDGDHDGDACEGQFGSRY